MARDILTLDKVYFKKVLLPESSSEPSSSTTFKSSKRLDGFDDFFISPQKEPPPDPTKLSGDAAGQLVIVSSGLGGHDGLLLVTLLDHDPDAPEREFMSTLAYRSMTHTCWTLNRNRRWFWRNGCFRACSIEEGIDERLLHRCGVKNGKHFLRGKRDIRVFELSIQLAIVVFLKYRLIIDHN